MDKYFLHGKLKAKKGYGKALSNILIDASKLVATVKGSVLYIIGLDEKDEDNVYITEIWESKGDHDSSLKVEGVKELIQKAIPILEQQPTKGQELKIIGGTGI